MCLSLLYGLPPLCVCVCVRAHSVQKLLRRAEEEKSELSLHIAAQEKQFKGLWGGGWDTCLPQVMVLFSGVTEKVSDLNFKPSSFP